MRGSKVGAFLTYTLCLRSQSRPRALSQPSVLGGAKAFTLFTQLKDEPQIIAKKDEEDQKVAEETEQGALSQRLSEMAEETMNTGSKSDRKLMLDVGFSEDLKRQLEERIAQTAFKAENRQAFTEAEMPKYAGQGTREQAIATAWTGTESLQDSALRMLDDSHKKLRQPVRIPKPAAINLRPATKKKALSVADRLVNARDRTSIYAGSQQGDLTEQEREKMRKELKERFTPGARPMPTTLQGLTSLANERIEDAIARGQFKNIQRGKGINTERDYTANSPFLDTTEYFMNKIIQKQEIVPPWIEKQQELVKLVASFRGRLRNDWKRHMARTISSQGGTIDNQVRKAKGYALAEEHVNPQLAKTEGVTSIDSTGSLTTITIEERMAAGVAVESSAEPAAHPEVTIKITESSPEDAPPQSDAQATEAAIQSEQYSDRTAQPSSLPDRVLPMPYPFRDAQWEAAERAYHTLAVEEINSLARSYNLMAPKVAQKPYYSLQRELKRCYAEVAPLVADEILDRSRKPKVRIEVIGHRQGGVMSKFDGGGHVAKVRDEDKKKGYGFKEFWRDLFSKDEEERPRRRNVA